MKKLAPLFGFVAVALAACYSPNFHSPGFYCHPDDQPACPGNQVCSDGRCVNPSEVSGVDGGQGNDGPLPGDDGGGGGHDLAGADFAGKPPGDMSHGTTTGCVKINELQTAGSGGASDEFVELYNSCASAASLGSYTLVYRSAGGANDVTFITFSGQSIAAGAWFVCGQTNFTGNADVRYTAAMASSGGGVALLNGSTILDSVGYGSATNAYVQGGAAPAPATAKSIERIPDGHDTANNGADFTVGALPTPGAANQ